MPRVVRNFWISAEIDGLASPLRGGPARKDGGFDLTVKVRDEGGIKTALTITGCSDGKVLDLYVHDANGDRVHSVRTSR